MALLLINYLAFRCGSLADRLGKFSLKAAPGEQIGRSKLVNLVKVLGCSLNVRFSRKRTVSWAKSGDIEWPLSGKADDHALLLLILKLNFAVFLDNNH